jgi:hypothetical protein
MFPKSCFTFLGGAAAAAVVAIGGVGVVQATTTDYEWLGTTSNSFTTSTNWSNATGYGVPTLGTTNSGPLAVANGGTSASPSSGSYMLYSPGSGITTTFSGTGNLLIGATPGPHAAIGSATVASGTLVGDGNLTVGQGTNADTALLTVSGGAVNAYDVQVNGGGTVAITGGTISNTVATDSSFINNGVVNLSAGSLTLSDAFSLGTTGGGTLNISGGTASVAGTLSVSTGGATTGSITLTGGSITAASAVALGTSPTETGGGTITFGTGSGVFEMTGFNSGSPNLTFGKNSYFNFLTGSLGSISINGASLGYFQGLVTAGDIKVSGSTATTSEFAYSSSSGQGIYKLVGSSVPEPATLGLVSLGGLGILLLGRTRKSA